MFSLCGRGWQEQRKHQTDAEKKKSGFLSTERISNIISQPISAFWYLRFARMCSFAIYSDMFREPVIKAIFPLQNILKNNC